MRHTFCHRKNQYNPYVLPLFLVGMVWVTVAIVTVSPTFGQVLPYRGQPTGSPVIGMAEPSSQGYEYEVNSVRRVFPVQSHVQQPQAQVPQPQIQPQTPQYQSQPVQIQQARYHPQQYHPQQYPPQVPLTWPQPQIPSTISVAPAVVPIPQGYPTYQTDIRQVSSVPHTSYPTASYPAPLPRPENGNGNNNGYGNINGSINVNGSINGNGTENGVVYGNGYGNGNSHRMVPTPTMRSYLLRQTHPTEFERKMTQKFGERFVPLNRITSDTGTIQYRMTAADGTSIDLTIDRGQSIVSVSGSPKAVDGTMRIVSLLDYSELVARQNNTATDMISYTTANFQAVRQVAEAIERSNSAPTRTVLNPTATTNSAAGNTAAGNPVTENRGPVFVAQNPQSLPDLPTSPNLPNLADFPNGDEPTATPQDVTVDGSNAASAEMAIGAAQAAGLIGQVQVEVIPDLDVVILRGRPQDVAIVEKMIRQIELTSRQQEPIVETCYLSHAESQRVTTMLTTLYNTVYASRRGTVSITALVKPNAILLIGRKESVETAKELLGKLDVAVDPNAHFQVFHLKHASSDTTAQQITNFFANRTQGLAMTVVATSDFRTNSVIVQGSPRDLLEVANLVRNIDSSEGPENQMKIIPLKNAMADTLATILQNAFSGTTTTTGGGFGTAATNQQRRNSILTFQSVDRENGGILRSGLISGDTRVTAVAASNSLLVSSPAETMPLLEAVIASLDTLPTIESQIKVFTIVNGDAASLVTMLRSIFTPTAGTTTTGTTGATVAITSRPGLGEEESALVPVRMAVDVRTNTIVATGSAGDLMTLEAILLSLDEDDMQNRKVMVYRLLNAPASNVATALQQYVTGEQQVDRTSNELRGLHELVRRAVVITPETVSNSLIVCATPQYFEEIRRVIRYLDERPPMVSIAVLIADVQMTNGCTLGVELGLQDSILFNRSSGYPGTVAAPGGLPGFLFGNLGPLGNNPTTGNTDRIGTQGVTSLGASRSAGSGFVFAASSESVSVLIQALETQGRVQVLSRPHITTLHNQPAYVQVGQEVPSITGTSMGTNGNVSNTVTTENVGLMLGVTPRVSADGLIVMEIDATKSKLGRAEDGVVIAIQDGEPLKRGIVDTTNIQTTVSARAGQTIILGGMITQVKTKTYRGVPYVSRIPILGKLFQYNSSSSDRDEMVMIMTPQILRNGTDTEIHKQQELSRIHWCAQDVADITGSDSVFRRYDHEGLSGNVIYGSEISSAEGVVFPSIREAGFMQSLPPKLDENNLPIHVDSTRVPQM